MINRDINFNDFKEYLKMRENPIIFDKEGKFIYFPVNKVMQTTLVREIFNKRLIVKKDDPALWNRYFEKTDFNNIYKFGITRHPVSKFESAFNYLNSINKYSQQLIENQEINVFVKNKMSNCSNPFEINPHFERQNESFYCRDTLLVNDLYQIESKENISRLYEKLNIKAEKKKIRRNKTQHHELLNSESIKILESIYKNDIHPLKYESMI